MNIQQNSVTLNHLAGKILLFIAVYSEKNGSVPIKKLISICQNNELVTSAIIMLSEKGYLFIDNKNNIAVPKQGANYE